MYTMGELWNVHSTVRVCITTPTESIPQASQILHIPVFKLDGLHHCIYSVRNFGLCQEKWTGIPHALHLSCMHVVTLSGKIKGHAPCTSPELHACSYSVRKNKRACPMHFTWVHAVTLLGKCKWHIPCTLPSYKLVCLCTSPEQHYH